RPACSARRRWHSRSSQLDGRRTARGLPDADRQPRGRDAARARGAARGRRARVRGHAHDEGAARPLRRHGRARALRRARRAPRGRSELREALAGEETLVAFESPRRVAATLAVLAELDPERLVAVCRELTKLHEEIVRGTARELAERYAEEPPRGEVVLVIAGG